MLPLERVLQNIRQLAQAGIIEIEFADDDFLGSLDPECLARLDALIDGMTEIGHDYTVGGRMTFRIFVRPNDVFRPHDAAWNAQMMQRLRGMKQAGLVRIYMGADSGCASQLQRYRRPATLLHTQRALEQLRSLGLGVDVGFIMFDPLMTLEELLANVMTFKQLALIKHNQWPFRPMEIYPGAPLYQTLKDQGLLRGENPDYGSYYCQYADARIASIARTVDDLSRPSRGLFYALKSLSKRQYDPTQKDSTTLQAQEYVELNGLVFLKLMEHSAIAFIEGSRTIPDEAITAACDEIDSLVNLVEADIRDGILADHEGFLREQVSQIYASQQRILIGATG